MEQQQGLESERVGGYWANFDAWAERLAQKTATFAEFLKQTSRDFDKFAAKVARDKKLPTWWTVDEVKAALQAAAWHNFFVRAGGFNPAKYRSAGAWIRWKARNRVMKDISRAKGECQHTRRGPGAPEFLTKTGEEADVAVAPIAESGLHDARQMNALAKVCAAVKSFSEARAAVVDATDWEVAHFVYCGPMKDSEFTGSFAELGIKTKRDAERVVRAMREASVLPRKKKVPDAGNRRLREGGEGLGVEAA